MAPGEEQGDRTRSPRAGRHTAPGGVRNKTRQVLPAAASAAGQAASE